ncbi:Protein of unknown function [Reichenbachiella faecimaris]|uniref:DUF2911 domain-containing protein n=1 Tax=Reichenbachiella faecimaris TaxID=692418 RepID=A0A1W2G8A5_REIFA|nr:DUF2911 domain-containing protein [Reichenbachiella faecimaris]SMD32662.1 Protein of unknown function [Reichenbachiella faecimaris]
MKTLNILLFALGLGWSIQLEAQEIRALDESPLDLAVFRPDGRGTVPAARIIYSRPMKKGRTMLGDKVPYGQVWRLGANQSTEINVYRDMTFDGKKLKAGNYTVYAIPAAKSWTIIFNSNLYTWGAFDYDVSKNVMSIEAPVKKAAETREAFGMAFEGKEGKGHLLMAWEDVEVLIPIAY